MRGKQNTRGRSFCADTENRPHVFPFLDEACTQPYEGGNQLDELTLYVK